MNLVLIFVVLPLATIIFSIALQRLLKCPILVAAIIFAIFLILTYTVFETDFLIFSILFAILAFVTAFLVSLFCRIDRRTRNCYNYGCNNNNENNNNERIVLNAEVVPSNNENSGAFRGCFRRRRW